MLQTLREKLWDLMKRRRASGVSADNAPKNPGSATNAVEHAADPLSLHLPGGVALPGQLSDALESGNLVVFVGAGASVDPPSSLPLFAGLTRGVLQLAGSTDPLAPDGRFDIQLGDIADTGFDVRGAVRNIIGAAGSSANRWHRAIVGLWADLDRLRVVTTNYDIHLESAAGADTSVWSAPALPLGHRFTGIVHLHGSLTGPDEGLVITDRHFGRAYLTEGWARRFLVGLFRTYVVIFIGYSHDDLVLQYLARGLPPDAQLRYALVPPDDDPARWDRLRIVAIPWESDPADRYGPAVLALEEWGRRAQWTHLDHESHIKSLTAGGPLLDPIEESYLTTAISDPVKVKAFTRHASGEEWLEWVTPKPAFKGLFDRSVDLNPAQWELARWFAHEQIVNGKGAALRAFGDVGGHLSWGLWHSIADAIWRKRPARPEDFEAWIAVLVDQLHDGDDQLLNYLAHGCSLPHDRRALMILLEVLFRPRLRFSPGIAWPGQAQRISVGIDVRADSHWIEEILQKTVLPGQRKGVTRPE